MTKEEVVALAEKLAAAEDLSANKEDLATLKKEAKMMHGEAESMADEELAAKYDECMAKIAAKENSLSASAYEEKKALVEKAKALLEATNFKKATEELNGIFDAMKAAARCTKEQDDALWAELKATRNEFGKKKQAYFDNLKKANEEKRAAKNAIIEKAEAALELESLKEAGAQMDALFEEWKKVGYSGKEDDALWEKFSAARSAFYAKKKAYYETMQATYAERVAKKEELIKKAKVVLANSEFTKEEINELKALRAAWKEVGFAGKEKDDALWNDFNGTINKYFDEMHEYND